MSNTEPACARPQAEHLEHPHLVEPDTLAPDEYVARIMCKTDGAVILRNRTKQFLVHTRTDILAFFAEHESDGALSLVTQDGEVAGIVFVHLSFDEALAFKDRHGDPSLALVGDALVVTAWLLESPCTIADLARLAASRPKYQLAVPAPGLGGWHFGRDEYNSCEFTRFSLRDLLSKFSGRS